jgi:hypothetical protein
MSVTKKTMDRYDVRAKGEWATICVREWQRDDTNKYHAGEILIHSSFGSWGNSWTACANRFKHFLTHIDFDYTFGKFMGSSLNVFDGEASTIAMRDKVIEERKQGLMASDDARWLWDHLDDADESSIESWVRSIEDIARNTDSRSIKSLLSEPWYAAADKPDSGAVGFWRDLWPEFVAHLKQEIAEPAEAV